MHRLLTEMPPERLTALYRALPEEVSRALDVPIGRALNSRPMTVARRPEALKIKALRSFLARQKDDDLAAEILRGYLLGPRKALVTDFLDATGVTHEDGQIEDEEAQPDPKTVAAAVKTLRENHPAEDLHLYLEVAARQWPDNDGLRKALEAWKD